LTLIVPTRSSLLRLIKSRIITQETLPSKSSKSISLFRKRLQIKKKERQLSTRSMFEKIPQISKVRKQERLTLLKTTPITWAKFRTRALIFKWQRLKIPSLTTRASTPKWLLEKKEPFWFKFRKQNSPLIVPKKIFKRNKNKGIQRKQQLNKLLITLKDKKKEKKEADKKLSVKLKAENNLQGQPSSLYKSSSKKSFQIKLPIKIDYGIDKPYHKRWFIKKKKITKSFDNQNISEHKYKINGRIYKNSIIKNNKLKNIKTLFQEQKSLDNNRHKLIHSSQNSDFNYGSIEGDVRNSFNIKQSNILLNDLLHSRAKLSSHNLVRNLVSAKHDDIHNKVTKVGYSNDVNNKRGGLIIGTISADGKVANTITNKVVSQEAAAGIEDTDDEDVRAEKALGATEEIKDRDIGSRERGVGGNIDGTMDIDVELDDHNEDKIKGIAGNVKIVNRTNEVEFSKKEAKRAVDNAEQKSDRVTIDEQKSVNTKRDTTTAEFSSEIKGRNDHLYGKESSDDIERAEDGKVGAKKNKSESKKIEDSDNVVTKSVGNINGDTHRNFGETERGSITEGEPTIVHVRKEGKRGNGESEGIESKNDSKIDEAKKAGDREIDGESNKAIDDDNEDKEYTDNLKRQSDGDAGEEKKDDIKKNDNVIAKLSSNSKSKKDDSIGEESSVDIGRKKVGNVRNKESEGGNNKAYVNDHETKESANNAKQQANNKAAKEEAGSIAKDDNANAKLRDKRSAKKNDGNDVQSNDKSKRDEGQYAGDEDRKSRNRKADDTDNTPKVSIYNMKGQSNYDAAVKTTKDNKNNETTNVKLHDKRNGETENDVGEESNNHINSKNYGKDGDTEMEAGSNETDDDHMGANISVDNLERLSNDDETNQKKDDDSDENDDAIRGK
jgi:hypothetical protein